MYSDPHHAGNAQHPHYPHPHHQRGGPSPGRSHSPSAAQSAKIHHPSSYGNFSDYSNSNSKNSSLQQLQQQQRLYESSYDVRDKAYNAAASARSSQSTDMLPTVLWPGKASGSYVPTVISSERALDLVPPPAHGGSASSGSSRNNST